MNAIKTKVLQLSLLALISMPILADIHDRIEYKLNRVLRDVEIINNEIAAECTVIRPEDFEDADGNLSQTYVISVPGKYCLGADINFAPFDDYIMPAIRIISDDVSLNLNGFTLNQVPDSAFDVAAIRIGVDDFSPDTPVFKNITIFNGNITNFNGTGIDAENFALFFDVPVAFESIILSNLNILDCGSTPSFAYNGNGINLVSYGSENLYDPTVPVGFKNVIIENCNVNRCLGNAAIYVDTVDNIIVKDTQANDFLSEITALGYVAAYYITARNLQMFNCQGNGTTDLDPRATGAQVGSFIQGGINVYIKDCQFNDTFGEADAIVNFNPSNSHNFVAENCQFNNNRGGEFARFIIAGIHMSDNPGQTTKGNGMKFINCQFNGTRVSDNAPGGTVVSLITGFVAVTLKNIVFENCQACNIITQNQGFDAYGFVLVTDPLDPAFPFANLDNITFTNCVVSDITGGRKAFGISLTPDNGNPTGNQSSQHNMVLENCVVERISSASSIDRVAGIAECLYPFPNSTQFPLLQNLFIRDCRISDVRAGEDNPFSAGILVESVVNPVLQNNSVSDCDRGILFTGTNDIIPNCFQLAATLEDALASPPVFIPLTVQLQVTVSPDPDGINPIQAFYTINGPRLTAPISAPGEITDPTNACSAVTNDLTGEIGIVLRDGACNSSTFVLNTEAAGAVATLIIDNTEGPQIFGGSPSQTKVAVSIRESDGIALLQSLDANPGSIITIDSVPSAGTYTFINSTQGNFVNAGTGDVDSQRDFICPSADLTALGWQPGDEIFFDCNGNDAIPDLVCSTTYFAIVYSPGFSENGVVQQNEVDNCSISGYQDDAPTTLSAWVDNAAFNNGTPVPSDTTNYAIAWAGVDPVDAGTLAAYPTPGNKYYNLSLIP